MGEEDPSDDVKEAIIKSYQWSVKFELKPRYKKITCRTRISYDECVFVYSRMPSVHGYELEHVSSFYVVLRHHACVQVL